MKEELEKIITQIINWYLTDEPMITEEEGINQILTLFNKRIEDSKPKIDNYLLPLMAYKAQDIINIIKKEVNK